MSTRIRRLASSALVAALAAMTVLLAPASPAAAHNTLRAATPAPEARLSAPPAHIILEFAQRLDPAFTTIVLSDASRRKVRTSEPTVAGATGTVTVDEPLAAGSYTVAYRIVSADGHPVQGSYSFTVDEPAAGAAPAASGVAAPDAPASGVATSGGAAPDAPASPAASSSRSEGRGPWPLAVGGLVVLAAAAGVFLSRRRRRGTTA